MQRDLRLLDNQLSRQRKRCLTLRRVYAGPSLANETIGGPLRGRDNILPLSFCARQNARLLFHYT